MKRIACTLALLSCVPLAAALADDAAPTYPLDTWSVVWKVVDVATHTGEEGMNMDMVVEGKHPATGEAFTQKRQHAETMSATYVSKALAVNEGGSPVRRLVYLSSWKREVADTVDGAEQAQEPDTSLTGLHLEVTWKDGAHAYTILTPDAKPSADGTQWLDKRFGKGAKRLEGRELEKLGRPPAPVKVGDTWRGDPANLDFPFALDLSASKVELALGAVENGKLSVPAQVSLKLIGWPLGEGVLASFTEGGVLEGSMGISQSMSPGALDAEMAAQFSLTGTATTQGMTLKLKLQFVGELKTTKGGEMPAAPATPAAPK